MQLCSQVGVAAKQNPPTEISNLLTSSDLSISLGCRAGPLTTAFRLRMESLETSRTLNLRRKGSICTWVAVSFA